MHHTKRELEREMESLGRDKDVTGNTIQDLMNTPVPPALWVQVINADKVILDTFRVDHLDLMDSPNDRDMLINHVADVIKSQIE